MLLERPVTCIKIALSNINICLLYIKRWKKRKNSCVDNMMNRQADELMIKDIKRIICGVLCHVKETTLHFGRHITFFGFAIDV